MDIRTYLDFPPNISAILWDMDGVLIDSLGFDVANCGRILHQVTGISAEFSRQIVEDGFALSPDDFWRYLAGHAQLTLNEAQLQHLIEVYEDERRAQAFPVLTGVLDRLKEARALGLKLAVVSNNPKIDVERILKNCSLLDLFDLVLGNDGGTRRKKPAPDTYLAAADLLNVRINDCAVIEDSLIGAEAGHSAGAYTIGVATGGTKLDALQASKLCDFCCTSLVQACS